MFKLFVFSPLNSILLTIALGFALFSDTPTWFRGVLFGWLFIERIMLHLALFFVADIFRHPDKLLPLLIKIQQKT